MKIATLLLLLIAAIPALSAQEGGLKVDVKAVAEGKAEPGKDYTLKLRFTVPKGYHAYHKDNPGYSQPIKVEWKELAGLKLVKATWPEPKKHKDDFSEEWELSGTFDIAYDFTVPADAKGNLTVTGTHETQFCDADGCLMSDGSFSATIEVAAEEVPAVKVAAAFEGEVIAGGEATLKLTYTFTKGYHLYAKDNPGFGLAPVVEFTDKAGLELKGEKWPEATKVKIEEDWTEWEYKDTFTVTYTFTVPKEAKGELKLAGKVNIQICDEDACHDRNATFNAALKIKPAKDEGASNRPREHGLMSIHAPPDARARPEIADKPQATVAPRFQAPGKPGGTVKLDMIFTLPSGFHAYHRDNEAQGGIGTPPKIEFTELSGFEVAEVSWPEGELVAYPDSPSELELPERFVLSFTLNVPADAYGPIKLKGKWSALICTEGTCYPNKGEFEGHTHVFYGDFDEAMSRAKAANKPLLVDFNGRNCAPCRRMEATVFTLPEVEALLEQYVIVSLMTDIGDDKANALWDKYKPSTTAGVPFYAVMDYDAKVLRGIASTLPAEKRAHEFVEFLKTSTAVEPEKPAHPEPVVTPEQPDLKLPAGLQPMPADLSKIFDFEAAFAAGAIKPGGTVTLELRFKLKEGASGKYRLYHPNSPHTVFEGKPYPLLIASVLDFGGLEPDGNWRFPEYHLLPANDPKNYFGADEWEYYGDFVIARNFRVPAAAEEGKTLVLTGTLAGQYCDDNECVWFLDMSKTPFGWQAAVTATTGGVQASITQPRRDGKPSTGPDVTPQDGAKPGPKEPPVEPKKKDDKGGLITEIEESGGLFWFLLGVFGLGMITLLTPCVLPVLPLTIAFFVKQSEQGRSPLAAAFIYCTCIVGVFTIFGLITSLLLGEQGAQIVSTNPWVNLGIGVLFTVFALSFFGLFELRMPSFMSSWISKKQMTAQKQGRGYATALLSGGSFAIISFSCTGPIAATILAGAAGGGGEESLGRWVPTLAMLVYASGLALPIFIMGMFPSLLKKLPKSGSWMNALKVVFAFIEIAVAVRYFAWAEIGFTLEVVPVWFNRDLVDAFWIACSIGAGLYLLGLYRMPHDHEKLEQVGVIRMLIATCFLAFAFYLLPGIVSGAPMGLLDGFMPPRQERPGGQGHSSEEKWYQDLDEARAEAKATGKPVFVDFTGVICANCRWVEKNIFPDSQVHGKLLNDFVLCQQWTDKDDDPKAKEYYAKYGQGKKGVPMYVVIDADGNMIAKFVPPQFINSLTAEEFAKFLDDALAQAK